MEKLIKQQWWKAGAVLILLYVFVVGLLVPLKPNLSEVTPTSLVLKPGIVAIKVVGYNTDFMAQQGQLRAWLKVGNEYALAAQSIRVIDEQTAELNFNLPEALPEPEANVASLVIDGPVDGFFVSPAAVQLTGGEGITASAAAWLASPISDLHQRQGMTFPYRRILYETIRNTYFHVSLWLAMLLIFIAAVVYAIQYLRRQAKLAAGWEPDLLPLLGASPRERSDYMSHSLTAIGLLFGLLGLLTGALWARYTWGSWWSWDIKQFTALIALLIYAGYFVLRASFTDPESRARLAAVYNIFALL
ncbi:MAG: cytochrome c biogenesis protein CcsA [Lewinella sp.]|nr:cytochrome c biogenesis protein CcsA [Lewinella sp.]